MNRLLGGGMALASMAGAFGAIGTVGASPAGAACVERSGVRIGNDNFRASSGCEVVGVRYPNYPASGVTCAQTYSQYLDGNGNWNWGNATSYVCEGQSAWGIVQLDTSPGIFKRIRATHDGTVRALA